MFLVDLTYCVYTTARAKSVMHPDTRLVYDIVFILNTNIMYKAVVTAFIFYYFSEKSGWFVRDTVSCN